MKALVLLSGGIDSTTCLAEGVNDYGKDEVAALCISYGQKHLKELESAEKVAAYYGVTLRKLELGAVFEGSDCSLLEGSSEDIPQESYDEQLRKTDGKPVSTYVPFRNGLFLSCAASVALSMGCEELYYGAHRDDAAGNAYPDCSEEFNRAISEAVYLGSGNQLRVKAPLVSLNKAEVVAKGLALGAPYKLTWSCYAGSDKPCGVCGTCRDRAKAFRMNGVSDPALSGSNNEDQEVI